MLHPQMHYLLGHTVIPLSKRPFFRASTHHFSIAKQTFGATHMVEARRAQRTAAVGQDTGPYSTADVDTAAPVPGEVLVPENERGREFAEPPTHAEAEAAAGAGTSPIRARTKGFFGRAADNIVRNHFFVLLCLEGTK